MLSKLVGRSVREASCREKKVMRIVVTISYRLPCIVADLRVTLLAIAQGRRGRILEHQY